MTESDFRRLGVALRSLGIILEYHPETYSEHSGWLTESDLNVVKASWSCISFPLGYYYEVVPGASGSAGVPWLTESARGVLELH